MGHVQKIWPKRIHGKIHMCVWLNIHQRVRKGESKSKFEGCKARNVQTIFDVIRAETKGVKA
jgi:hypothetical protein